HVEQCCPWRGRAHAGGVAQGDPPGAPGGARGTGPGGALAPLGRLVLRHRIAPGLRRRHPGQGLHQRMKILDIQAAGLRGATPEGGWSNEIQPEDCVHTLIAVSTDEGLTGWGSVFTTEALVKAALALLEPLYRGENPLEPERVSEKLHANTFWMGRGGTITHTISGIDIAMWDILGKVTGQPVGRLLGGCYRKRVLPYASLLMEEPDAVAESLRAVREQGYRAFKIGWGPFGRESDAMDQEIVRAARDTVGSDALLMVDAGASDAFWKQSFKWAVRTAEMLADLRVYWFEEPLPPDNFEDYALLRQNSRVLIACAQVLTPSQSFFPCFSAPP